MPKIRISEEVHEVYKRLASDQDDRSEKKVFDTMRDVFMIALSLGVKDGHRTPLSRTKDIFDDHVLRTQDWNVINAIALTETNSIDVLENAEERLKIAQEYANTGIRILRANLDTREVAQSVAQLLLR